MKNFACTNCHNEVYFENVKCLRCNHELGFEPKRRAIVALRPAGRASYWIAGEDQPTSIFAYCENRQYQVCNWLMPTGTGCNFCVACALNRTIPNLGESGNLQAWHELEIAKKRLVYSLLRFGLPMDGTGWGKGRLSFSFLRNATTLTAQAGRFQSKRNRPASMMHRGGGTDAEAHARNAGAKTFPRTSAVRRATVGASASRPLSMETR